MTTEMQSFYTPSTSSHISSHAPAAMDELISKYSSSMSNSNSGTTTSNSGTSNTNINTTSATASSSFSSKSTSPNVLRRFSDRVWMEYYRYQVTFGLYVMTPSEKLAANTFVMVVLSLLFWALLLYFPSLLYNKLSRLVWLLTGHSGEEVGAVLGILDSQSQAASGVGVAAGMATASPMS